MRIDWINWTDETAEVGREQWRYKDLGTITKRLGIWFWRAGEYKGHAQTRETAMCEVESLCRAFTIIERVTV